MHTASVLLNGKILVTGGDDGDESLSSAELYDPVTGNWTNVDDMQKARSMHTALVLPNGKVLVIGGDDNGRSLKSAELFD
ncbi:unnamed protein product, partial [Adineta steineri]